MDFDNPTVETELQLIEAVMNEVAIANGQEQPIHLVGHSYGGVVALALALKGSVKLCKLTLYEPVATWLADLAENRQLQAAVDSFLKPYRRDVATGLPFAGGQVIDFWCGSSEFHKFPDRVKSKFMLLQKNNIRHWDVCTKVSHNVEDIKGLDVPTHLVVGENSSSVAHGIIDLLVEWLPNRKRYLIPGANHFLVTSHIDACLAAM
jgi:pimeloyl-ACP methyl ester carboxylesterase